MHFELVNANLASINLLPNTELTALVKSERPKQTRSSSKGARKPQSNGRQDGKKATLSMGDISIVGEEQLISCRLRDGNDREEKLPIKCDIAQRYINICLFSHDNSSLVQEMLERCNRDHHKPLKLYLDLKTGSAGAKNEREQEETFIKASATMKPVIFRCYGNRDGGLGISPKTQLVTKFLAYHTNFGAPSPYCQLQGQRAGTIEHVNLLSEFIKAPQDRDYKANVLGYPLMHNVAIVKEINWPRVLGNYDLLQHTSTQSPNFDRHRKDARPPGDSGFAVVSMQGSFTTFHLDKLSTFAVLSEGCKIWAFFPDSEENRKVRDRWQESDGLGCFKDCFVVSLHPGDLLLIPSGWHHAVYTVVDSLMLGGHYLVPEQLAKNVLVATHLKTSSKISSNDSLTALKKYFNNILTVSLYHRFTDFEEHQKLSFCSFWWSKKLRN